MTIIVNIAKPSRLNLVASKLESVDDPSVEVAVPFVFGIVVTDEDTHRGIVMKLAFRLTAYRVADDRCGAKSVTKFRRDNIGNLPIISKEYYFANVRVRYEPRREALSTRFRWQFSLDQVNRIVKQSLFTFERPWSGEQLSLCDRW